MSRDVRTYGVEEANQALAQVRPLVERIVAASEKLPDLEDQVRISRYRVSRPDPAHDDRVRLEGLEQELSKTERELAAAAIALQEMGVQLKDARTGLVDFLTQREGELVELCWRLGEDRVGHWHRIGEGFAGRKPL